MKEKKSDIAQFAVYAKQVFKYKKCTADYQQQVEYIKSLFEVSLDWLELLWLSLTWVTVTEFDLSHCDWVWIQSLKLVYNNWSYSELSLKYSKSFRKILKSFLRIYTITLNIVEYKYNII